ncbi:MAG: SIS domain-containing protein [Dehalococcoidia bacterium]
MKKLSKKFVKEYLEEIRKLLDLIEADLTGQIGKLAIILAEARQARKTIFIVGNGGSAATASHFAGDLSKLTIAEGFTRFKAIALTDNTPSLLAWANDVNYEEIFVGQLRNLLEPGDIVIGISASGNSMNVIKAIEYANKNGAFTIGFCGYDGGKLLKCARESILVPCTHMPRVEDIHMLMCHLLASLLLEATKVKGTSLKKGK